MINLFKKEDLKLLLKYPNEVVENIENVIDILDENYGCNRKLTDDGGYICIIGNSVVWLSGGKRSIFCLVCYLRLSAPL